MKKGIRFITLCSAVLGVLILSHLLLNFGITNYNQLVCAVKKDMQMSYQFNNTIEGDFLDCDGNKICVAVEKGVPGYIEFPAYHSLIGYSSKVYGQDGLRETFFEELWSPDKESGKGKNIKLTTNTLIQQTAYEQVKGTDGCVVVLENKTGKIISLVSTKKKYNLDANNISDKSLKEASSYKDYFIENWKIATAPGSIYKCVTSIPIIESGLENKVYFDKGLEVIDEGYKIHNYGNYSYGNVSLSGALKHSVNTYFANMAVYHIGSFKLKEVSERFMIGKPLELDYCAPIKSSNGLSDVSKSNIAATGFGQGALMLTPINMATIAQAIANDGVMIIPHLISSIGDETFENKTENTVTVADKETIQKLKSFMMDTALHYGIKSSYNIGAKTGTAQLPNGLNRATFLSFNEKYTVIVSELNCHKDGGDLKHQTLAIYDALNFL